MKIHASKVFSLLLVGVTYGTTGFAQTTAPQGMAAEMNLKILASGGSATTATVFDDRYQGVKGSPFYVDAWVPGQVEVKAGNTGKTQVFQDLKLKYDVFSNLLLAVMPQSKDTLVLNTTPVISFHLELPTGGTPLEFRRIKEARELDPALGNEFFAVLHDSKDGKVALVKRAAKKKVAADFKGPYSSGQAYDEIVNETNYYLVANGKMQRVKLNKKSVLEVFPEKADVLKAYMSAQKLAMSSEADLLNVVQYYQSL
ncbi:hypothetical protein ACFSC6_21525 [Rufibacter sediminis]|uniref:Molecular chaperone n=1 Tax=Rufibacter sediminis TaxID=2762756 RepID=A0ABR6VRD2_9BACT|nr:hypothetical protein [Rufibacter sediminis]MBC3539710.1 hypothetical protein [Rufibacter sediminis]